MKKLKTIIYSRFRKQHEETFWIKARREICLSCSYNSINTQGKNFTQNFLATLSFLLSFLLGRLKDEGSYGQCLHPDCGCDLYFKTQEPTEYCEDLKWKRIDDKIVLNIRKSRENGNKKTNR